MRRLRRTMHDQVEALRSKQLFDQGPVTNIDRGVREALGRALKPLEVPQRVSRGPEEYAAHVVIHAGDLVALPVKMFHGFRTNQPAASCNEHLHVASPFSRSLPFGRASGFGLPEQLPFDQAEL